MDIKVDEGEPLVLGHLQVGRKIQIVAHVSPPHLIIDGDVGEDAVIRLTGNAARIEIHGNVGSGSSLTIVGALGDIEVRGAVGKNVRMTIYGEKSQIRLLGEVADSATLIHEPDACVVRGAA